MSILLSVSAFGWFANAIRTCTGVPWIVGLVVLLLLGPFLQPQLVVFAGVRRLVQAGGGRFWRTTLAGAGVWVGVEWLVPKLFGAALALVAVPGRRRRPAGRPRVPVRSSRTMDGPSFAAPTRTERLFNRLFGALVGLGIGLPHNFLLEVRGRRTGRTFATPVDVLAHDGRRFLVAARGETQWVRNARASGRVVLRKGFRREELRLRAVPDRDKPPLLKAYLDRFKLTVQRYFPVPAGSPAADLAPLAGRYPVFELVPPEAPSS
jgi:deazaflavin-dependent oxidoreductase (nitroreductase family)